MEWALVLKSILSLMFVIGLMFVVLWAVKYCQSRFLTTKLADGLRSQKRIKIIENKRIDVKNSLVLVECDSQEYLLLLSPSQSIVLNNVKSNLKKGKNNEA